MLLERRKMGATVFKKPSKQKQVSLGKEKLLLTAPLILVLRKIYWEVKARRQTMITRLYCR
jgi:hypothetical protein